MATYEITAPDGKTYEVSGNGTQEQALAHFKANWKPNMGGSVAPTESKPQAKNAGNIFAQEDVTYDPMTGLPLSNASYVAEPEGATKVAQKALTTAAGVPVNYAMATAKPVAGITQLVSKLFGSERGNEPVKALNQIEQGVNQQSYSPVTKAASLAGDIANPLYWGAGNIVGKGANLLPTSNLVKNVASGVGTGAAIGAMNPVNPESQDFAGDKIRDIALNSVIGGGLPIATKGAQLLGKGVKNAMAETLGFTTGSGAEAIKQAGRAGLEGGETGKRFAENLRGKVPIENVLADAQSNLNTMRQNLSNQYRSGMMDVSKDKTVLDLAPVEDLIQKAKSENIKYGEYKDEGAHKAIMEVQDIVSRWANKNPAEAHTPEGLDFLKQKINNEVLSKLDFQKDKFARKLVGDVYSGIKNTINEQAPTYAKVMKDYQEGADLIGEISKSMAMNPKAADYTKINRLQSIMRNNVNTNYGYRKELVDKMVQEGGKDILPSLAGQQLNSITPRGLTGKGIDVYALATALHNPIGSALEIAATSPRLVGEGAYLAGKVARPMVNLANSGNPEQRRLALMLLQNSMKNSPTEENK